MTNIKASEMLLADNGWCYQSAVQLASWIRERKITSTQLTEAFISRIEALDELDPIFPPTKSSGTNIVVVRDFERARVAAKDADDILQTYPTQNLPPLLGVPMTIKENNDVASTSGNLKLGKIGVGKPLLARILSNFWMFLACCN